MQPSVLYIIIAACLIAAVLYFRRSGYRRWGLIAGIVMAATAAVFSGQLIMLPNSMGQTVLLFGALAICIVMFSVLINRVLEFLAPKMQARRQERLRAAQPEPEQEQPELEEGVIDIQAERMRRAGKALGQNEEYFYEQSQPLAAESKEDAYAHVEVFDDEWLVQQEMERRQAMETQTIIEHKKQVAEAQAISGGAEAVSAMPFAHAHHAEGNTLVDEGLFAAEAAQEIYVPAGEAEETGYLPSEQEMPDIKEDDGAYATEEKPEDAIEILDSAWTHRDAGEWDGALEAYARFCSLVDDDRLRLEVEVEALNTMISAEKYEQATDKVFEILSYEGELSSNEKQQIIKVLEHMQNI